MLNLLSLKMTFQLRYDICTNLFSCVANYFSNKIERINCTLKGSIHWFYLEKKYDFYRNKWILRNEIVFIIWFHLHAESKEQNDQNRNRPIENRLTVVRGNRIRGWERKVKGLVSTEYSQRCRLQHTKY